MDWNMTTIDTKEFTFYEEENDSRNLTGYHVFCVNAAREYQSLSDIDKITHILSVSHFEVSEFDSDSNSLPNGYDSCDFPVLRTIISLWVRLDSSIKYAWAERAKRLNSRPVTGQFEELPSELANLDLPEVQSMLREFLCTDLSPLVKSVLRAIRNKNQRDLYKKAVKLPYAIQVEQQVWHTGTVSGLLLHALFGDNLDKFAFDELISTNGDPFIFHVASMIRMKDIFSIDDTCMSTLVDREFNHTHHLTSYGILENDKGMCVKAYACGESDTTIDFMFNDTRTTTKIIQFERPLLQKDTDSPYNILGYIWDIFPVDGYILVHFSPAAVYVSFKNSTNFKLQAANVCADKDGRIFESKSS